MMSPTHPVIRSLYQFIVGNVKLHCTWSLTAMNHTFVKNFLCFSLCFLRAGQTTRFLEPITLFGANSGFFKYDILTVIRFAVMRLQMLQLTGRKQ